MSTTQSTTQPLKGLRQEIMVTHVNDSLSQMSTNVTTLYK